MRYFESRLARSGRAVLFLSLFGISLCAAGCCCLRGNAHRGNLTESLQRAAIGGDQVLVVTAQEGSPRGELSAFERTRSGWRQAFGPVPAMLGRNGLAAPGEKREGDGRTPSGMYPLESVFGYAAHEDTRMPYRQATENDLWVDAVDSPDYNTWVRKGETAAKSFEVMKLPDHRYRHGVVIGYNRTPIVKGKGSAIFLHVWLKEGVATSGCVAIDEPSLVRLIQWLDPARKPKIVLATSADLAAILTGGGEEIAR